MKESLTFVKRDSLTIKGSLLMQLYQRVEKVARERTKSIPDLAEKIGIKYPTFRGYLNAEREDNLWPHLPKILTACPEVNDIWLYLGRGPMLKSENAAPPLTAINAAGKYTGDLLNVALGKRLPEQAAAELGWSVDSLLRLLESREIPSFNQIEQLYTTLDIDPAYLFHGDERRMHRPKDALLQVYYALGEINTEPNSHELVDIFGVTEDEANTFLKDWRRARREKENLVLPESWLKALEERCRFDVGWLADGVPPVIQQEKTPQNKKIQFIGGGDSQKPPTPHIDAALLQQVIEILEEHLQGVQGKLSPAAKSTVVSQLYELLVEQEVQAGERIQVMRQIMVTLAKAANE